VTVAVAPGGVDARRDAARSVRIPISQIAQRHPRLDRFEDRAQRVSDQRIRRQGDGFEIDEDAVAMATMVRAKGGGSLRTMNGAQWFENGWHRSRKAGHLLHWEGETALWQLLRLDTDGDAEAISSESVGFEWVLNGSMRRYTVDVEVVDPSGRRTLLEVKRTERDLDDPEYRLALAYVRETCRRCGIDFRIVYRDEIFSSLVHRRNACLFASRGFVAVEERHMSVLGDHRRATGGETEYGALAEALEPGHPVAGKAVVQGMLVRRLLRMDLTLRLDDASPLTID